MRALPLRLSKKGVQVFCKKSNVIKKFLKPPLIIKNSGNSFPENFYQN